METYQVDLRDLLRPEASLTPRYLFVLIKGLPLESRFNAQKRGGQQFHGWDEGRYVNVAIVNAVRALQYTYVQAHSKKNLTPPDPFPIPERVKKTKSQVSKPGSFANLAASMILAARKRREEWQQESKSDGSPSASTPTPRSSDESFRPS